MTTTLDDMPPIPREPSRARAVFSTEDFALLQKAVLTHLRSIADGPESLKYSHLYHRLGRLG